MKQVGIVLDSWKLPIFERHLKLAGFKFKQSPGVTRDTLTLTVMVENYVEIEKVIRGAQGEAFLSRAKNIKEVKH